ncbi:MAG: hypothetical protein ACUZ8H_03835 [Candidatus Anammoxibacter sp.]
MNLKRLDQSRTHELLIEIFGSIMNAARVLNVSKNILYKICAGEDTVCDKKIERGFATLSSSIEELKGCIFKD